MRFAPRPNVRARLILSFVGIAVLSWFVSSVALHAIFTFELEAARERFEKERATAAAARSGDDPSSESQPARAAEDSGAPPPWDGAPPPEPESEARGREGAPPPGGFGGPGDRGRGRGRGHGPPPWWGLFERLGLVRALVLIAISIAPALLLGSRFVKRIRELDQGARAFSAAEFRHRVPVRGADELDEVASTMNKMADRVAAHIAAAEEDARRKQQLLADLAHELRSPVATLRMMSEALRDGLADDPGRRQSAVAAIASSAERLQRLVDDSLTLARLGLDQLPLHVESLDLTAVAAEAVERHRRAAEAVGVTLHAPDRGASLRVEADRHRMDQVLDNLLTNAIDHTGSGTEVRVVMEDGDLAGFSVVDNGRGVAPEELPYLREPFYRCDASRTPGAEHVGLGLGIATGLARLHGGDLTIMSEPGEGTTVTVRVPRSQPHVGAPSEEAS